MVAVDLFYPQGMVSHFMPHFGRCPVHVDTLPTSVAQSSCHKTCLSLDVPKKAELEAIETGRPKSSVADGLYPRLGKQLEGSQQFYGNKLGFIGG